MASTHRSFFIASIFLGLLAIGTNARPGVHFHPCNTFFISYTVSSIKSPNFQNPSDPNPSRLFTIFRVTKVLNPKIFELIANDGRPVHHVPIKYSIRDDIVKPDIVRPPYPFGSFGISSLRQRARDILSVVAALLFGVGCGALTSATIYLAWSLITNRFDFNDSDREGEDGDDSGYVKIPEYQVAAPAKVV